MYKRQGLYLPKNSWHKIPEERKKSADYYVEVDEAVFLFELKAGLLGLGAKQQVPDVGQIDIFYNRNIKEAYEQLKASEQEYKGHRLRCVAHDRTLSRHIFA